MLSESNYNELVKLRSAPLQTGGKMDSRIRYFRDQKYIEPNSYRFDGSPDDLSINPTSWRLTPRGEDALAEFEYVHNKDSQDERRQRFDRKIAVLGIAVSLVTFILGLLAEHFVGIADWISSLFGH